MCDCITLVNEKLAEYNTQLSLTIALRDGTLKVEGVRIETHKINDKQRGKPMAITAAYCPFCGEKYEHAETEAGA